VLTEAQLDQAPIWQGQGWAVLEVADSATWHEEVLKVWNTKEQSP
jgi:hypothetical protein